MTFMNGAEIIGSTINLVKPTLIRTTPDAVSFSLTLVGCCVRNIPRWYAAVKRLTWATSYKIPLWHSSESESFTHSFFSFLNFRNELTVTIVESKGITSRWCYYWRLRCQRSCPGIFGASLSKQLSSSPLFSVTFSRSMSRGSSIAPLTFGAIIHTTSQFIFEFFPRSLHQNWNFFQGHQSGGEQDGCVPDIRRRMAQLPSRFPVGLQISRIRKLQYERHESRHRFLRLDRMGLRFENRSGKDHSKSCPSNGRWFSSVRFGRQWVHAGRYDSS